MTRKYIGQRTPDGFQVVVIDPATPDQPRPLNPRFDLRNHSPTGYEISYSGSGPAQLSLALLADALGDDRLAERQYQDYKRTVIARLTGDRFEQTEDDIKATVAKLEAERGAGAVILAAAIRHGRSVYTLPCPARHHDVIRLMAEDFGLPTPVAGEQGFLDTELEFLDRRQAASRALEGGQVASLRWPPELFSEDLW